MMLHGPIVPTILSLSAPNVLNVAMQSLVSIGDGFFVGQLGTVELAALALVFPSQMALGQMSAGAMGGGISSSVARAMGSGNRAAAEAAAAHGLAIALGMACLFAIVFVGFGRSIYGALGGSGHALEGATAFANVLFLGCFAHWIANSLASVLRGTGDMKTPGYALVATAALQIPLTGALTLGWFGLPALGIRGPAASAVISFTLAALWMAWRLTSGHAAIRLHWPTDGFRRARFDDILKVGLIACLVVILTNGTVLLVTGLIGREGDAAIAGYGIGSRLEYMLVPISFGIGAALTALVGTNIGARQYARAHRLAWSGALMAGAVAATIGVVVAIWPDLWLGLFTRDAGALASGRTYLSIVGPAYGFFGLAMALYFASQGTGEMIWPVVANLSRIVIAVCGSLFALDVMGWGTRGLFTFVALGIVSFSAILAFSTTRPAWRG
ncbi:putative efflux protein, MATE family [Enhydrobacter aerosaccus]|uniref:Putative efflux protein, MATE family n=2 Tax=Enhydrobacter aerosaccus TaxID=225324 RepID=A0A1T4JUM1_9HYPH|nr:putative efflux protein, MATE family [Enhydrobacter aerosaccus]